MLEVSRLRAGYGLADVVRGVDLAVRPGEIVAVLGANGAGKTTLNRALSGVVAVRGGAIRFLDETISGRRPADIVARGLVHVPEGRRIFPNMSVRENLIMGELPPRPQKPRPQPRAGIRDLPAPCRALSPGRRHAFRRRAADARDRARDDGGAEAPDPG
jgi:ABC-type branched-subunit amino acid transport system ATPase component